MYPCTVSELTEHLDGRRHAWGSLHPFEAGAAPDQRQIERVVTESGRVVPGSLFVALRGRNRHGVEFAGEAAARGAVAILTDQLPTRSVAPESAAAGPPLILVPHALTGLQQLAVRNRNRSAASVIGITGSVGKTTTRQMIYCVLSQQRSSLQSPANFNNEIGLPLALLDLSEQHRYAVLELGAGRPGDIRFLCRLARPDWAVVTRVAPCHLESFGSLQAIRLTKQELVEEIPASGCVFLCADQPEVAGMSRATSAQVEYFGLQAEGVGRCQMVSFEQGRSRIRCGTDEFVYEGGRQLLLCAAAAVTVGRRAGLSAGQIAAGLQQFRPDRGRGRLLRAGDWQILDETYNCSPESAVACLKSLSEWNAVRRILVLGDMLELGESERELHCDVAATLVDSAVDLAIFCGRLSSICVTAAAASGYAGDRLHAVADNQQLQCLLSELLQPGDLICLKGSRGLQLEQTVNWLLRQATERGGQVIP
ncbi:MAG: UDP-N-acetylmuramoyl-tripeptide--D-alanyl-D-alanine ligase [Planctomyces sp.]